MAIRIKHEAEPTDLLRDAVLGRLAAFNAANGFPADVEPIAISLRNEEDCVVGGLWGRTVYDWLFVEFLIVPEDLRGRNLGAELVLAAEAEASRRGCVGSWLTTFSFQARGFYEKLGYSLFGELENSPDDNVRLFMRKRL